MRSRIHTLLGVAGLVALVGAASADIVGTAHDFSGEIWSDGEICLPCHTPHNAMDMSGLGQQAGVGQGAPLWNHEMTVANYDLYIDGTLQLGVAFDEALDSRSLLCMSCHDGTVALDSFGGVTGSQIITGSEKIGQDLTDDHPVGAGAIYPLVPWMNDPANWETHGFELQDMLIDGGVERVVSCTTCHEPHSRTGFANMLWVDNNASALCLTCHIK